MSDDTLARWRFHLSRPGMQRALREYLLDQHEDRAMDLLSQIELFLTEPPPRARVEAALRLVRACLDVRKLQVQAPELVPLLTDAITGLQCAMVAERDPSPAAPHPAQQAGAMTEEDICAILKALGFGWSEVTNAYTMLRSLSKMGYQLVPPAIPAQQAGQPEDAKDAARYRALNTPEVRDFIVAVEREALHQRDRWGASGDAGKTDADWFWLIGYLAGKAIRPDASEDKRLHHIITTAAACLNWHGARTGHYTDMRPGIAEPAVAAMSSPTAKKGEGA